VVPRLINGLLTLALISVLLVVPLGGGPQGEQALSDGRHGASGVAYAQGSLPAIPASWPSHVRSLQLGRASPPGDASAMMSRAPFAFRYQYLSAGVNTGNGWATWNTDGHFVTYYIQDSVANGVIPVFTYYMIYQSLPGGGSEQSAVVTNLNNTSTMQAYFADLKLFFQRAGAFPNTTVVLHVEPDLWGYVQATSGNDNAASVSAKVGSTGVAEVAGLPDNVAGLAQGLARLRNQYAPNVILAYHVSDWGTGTDVTINDPSDSQVDGLGDRAAAYYHTLGADFDLAFGELSDRDSAFDQVIYGMGPEAWWSDADFTRHARFMGRFSQGSGKRLVMWQVPFGNTKMRAMNNTDGHYQDNRVEKLLDEPARARLQAYVNAGVMAFLFGAGEYRATHPTDQRGDGVTNPAPVNGNTQTSYNSDDDGGFFHNRAAAYYTTGAMSIPGGSGGGVQPTPTPTLTPNPGGSTPTPVVPPGSFTQTASVSPGSVAAGGSVTITGTFASGSGGTYLTDIEVYSASNTKLHQQWFDHQTFAGGQHRAFQTTWNVPANTAPGTYTVKLGTFAPNWTSFFAWNDAATTFTVTAPGGPTATHTPVPTATITPTPMLAPVECDPRPSVTVRTTTTGNSLRIDLAATGQNNRLLALQFTGTANALVDLGGQNGRTGAFTVHLPGTSATTTFSIRRASGGPATASLTVVDRCGSWSTFVGGGNQSGF
jgi:hypothetical protein